MDDVTSILQTASCASRLLKNFDELFTWARMEIKAAKSRSLLIRKGVPQDKTTFVAGIKPIPRLTKKPIRGLGRHYTANLSNRQMRKQAKQQPADGLAKIDHSHLPGKLHWRAHQRTQNIWNFCICMI